MHDDMRNFVVFRVEQDEWDNGRFNSSDLDDWIHNNTIEGTPCVGIGESDFRHQYLIVGFSTESDARTLRKYLRDLSFVDLAFDE